MEQAISIALVGAGHLGTFHGRALKRILPGQPAWVVDVDAQRAATLAAELGARATTDLAEALAHTRAAIIATPTETHAAIGGRALTAGCHTFIEKPLASSPEEGAALVRQAETARRVLRVGHIERFNPIFRALRAEIAAPLFIAAERLAPFVPRSLDVDIVLDLMIHDLDLVLDVVPAEVVSIDAVGVPVLTAHEDIATARLRFANGVVADLTASRVSQEKSRRVRFFSSRGYHSLDLLRRCGRKVTLSPAPDGEIVVPERGRFHITEEKVAREAPDPMEAELLAFLEAAHGRPSPGATGSDGLRALEIAIAIRHHVRESLARLADAQPSAYPHDLGLSPSPSGGAVGGRRPNGIA
ncbi:MAG: Gfo/Idh/MocA family oxidoreductase [Candidatus Eisenbacteria bacterium]|nr:Gfo/Idh/MocA family oxidoreductase [Candidatus Eisenbacteria bacterium]